MANTDGKFLRILLIDDNPDDRVSILRELRSQFQNLQATQIPEPETFKQAMNRGDFDLAITDYQLHWTDGLTVLSEIKTRYPDCPVIMFTGTGSEEVAVAAMKLGLDDYVLKSPKHLKRLTPTVTAVLERARQRVQLRQAEARYRELFEGIPVGVYQTSPSGEILDANPAFVKMFGYPNLDALRAVNARSLYAQPQRRDEWLALMRQNGVVLGFEAEMRCYDGGTVWVSGDSHQVLDQNRRVLRYNSIITDITERKRAEQSLKMFRTLMDHSPDIIEIVDPATGRYLDANERAYSSLGLRRDELLAMTYRDLDPVAAANPAIERELARTGTALFEGVHRRKDGTSFPVEVSLRRITLDKEYVISIVRDITERKQAEQKIKDQLAELQRWYQVTLDREDRTIQLKREVNELLRRLKEPIRYPSAAE